LTLHDEWPLHNYVFPSSAKLPAITQVPHPTNIISKW